MNLALIEKLVNKSAKIGIVGLGYVGQPIYSLQSNWLFGIGL